MMGTVEIAERCDLQEILRVQKAAFAPIAACLNRTDLPPMKQKIADIEADYDKQLFFKYMLDGRIVGSVRAQLDNNGACWIYKLVVLPDFQSRGIGKALMDAVHDRFQGCTHFELFTGKNISYIVAFYQSLGYQETRTQTLDGIEMVFMTR
jgi:ribosomal protein S18 acetylase RimI-like enzyme